ncbi:Flp family type IVb pilin [Sphingomonas sp. KRR8]|uniref:Flp family type IVb pilin n=1 Tax=Sphingomonas sp. KRR8 TaxID=2942996 RepID=UPI00201FE0F8|nr:Flp family type IVb pilin [Sphingomonas sp. KRR8]URD60872.1 Flp family type IVb pilin [Sphingomonas sp. KRR8]
MNMFLKMMKDEAGASAAEYALILAIVGTGIAVAALGLGNSISGAMTKATNCINGPSSSTC